MGIDKNIRIVAREVMNIAKNEEQRVLWVQRKEGLQWATANMQGLNGNGGIPARPLRLEAGSCSKQVEWLWEANPTELTPKQLAIREQDAGAQVWVY